MPELTISENSRFMRVFRWLWGGDSTNLNVCQLFWGTTFFFFAFLRAENIGPFPRITYLYGVVALIFLMLSAYIGAALFAVMAVGFILFVRKLERMMESDDLLAEAGRAAKAAEWIGMHIFEPSIEAVERAVESPKGARLIGFLSVAAAYIQAIKERSCFMVKVV
jgi:hypothetical protein